MRVSVIPSFRSFCSNESLKSSDILGPKASIRFRVQHHHVLVTNTDGGSETILGQESRLFPEKVFFIEFPYLLLHLVTQNYIHHMLTQIEIPPSYIERLKRQLSTYATRAALLCNERKSRFLDIVVELNVQLVEYHEERRSIEQDLFEAVQALLTMDIIDGDEGFTLVPASRSSIEALENKKFDDTEDEEEESSSVETCMVCMEEFESGVDIARLPCSHFFHSECIVKWLENKNSCPLCRFAMPAEEE